MGGRERRVKIEVKPRHQELDYDAVSGPPKPNSQNSLQFMLTDPSMDNVPNLVCAYHSLLPVEKKTDCASESENRFR